MRVITFVFQVKMLKEVHSLTDTLTFGTKIRMVFTFLLIMLLLWVPTETLLHQTLTCLNMLFSVLSSDMLRLILIPSLFGKHSSVTLLMVHRL